jgi:hypothetical protein
MDKAETNPSIMMKTTGFQDMPAAFCWGADQRRR